jgi:site-specific DNA recombinase
VASIEIKLSVRKLTGDEAIPNTAAPPAITRKVRLNLPRRGVETKLIIGGVEQSAAAPDSALVKLVSRAYGWWHAIASGTSSLADIIEKENLSDRYISKILEGAFLASAIVERIVKGRQPPSLTWQKLMETPALHLGWRAQERDFSSASVDRVRMLKFVPIR